MQKINFFQSYHNSSSRNYLERMNQEKPKIIKKNQKLLKFLKSMAMIIGMVLAIQGMVGTFLYLVIGTRWPKKLLRNLN